MEAKPLAAYEVQLEDILADAKLALKKLSVDLEYDNRKVGAEQQALDATNKRALALVGAAHLTIMGVMTDNPPRWLTDAALAPVSAKAAQVIQTVLPTLGKGADALTPMVGSSVREGFSDQ